MADSVLFWQQIPGPSGAQKITRKFRRKFWLWTLRPPGLALTGSSGNVWEVHLERKLPLNSVAKIRSEDFYEPGLGV